MAMTQLEHAVSLHQQGMLDAASEAYLALLKHSPKDINVLNFLGILCFQRGMVQEGAKYLRKCLQIKPDFAQAHNNLGNGFMQAGNLKEAIQSFSRAVALAPNYVEAHHNLANAYGKQKDFEKALQSAKRAVSLAPGFSQAWVALAVAFCGLGRHQDALEACERALKIPPGLAEAALVKARILWGKRLCPEALEACDLALQLSPGLAEALLIKARVLWEQNQYLDSIATYRRAITKYADDSDVLLEFGLRLLIGGRPDEALQCLEHAVELSPEGVAGIIRLGIAYDGLRRFEDAESCFRKAAALSPSSGDAYFYLSKTLRVQLKNRDAEVAARRAVELDPESLLFLFHLATLLADVDRLDEAFLLLQDLLVKDPGNPEVPSLILFLSNYSGSYASEHRYQMALEYGRIVAEKVDEPIGQWSVGESADCLKVGLVSGDLQTHPVGLFLESVLPRIDREKIKFVAYPTHRSIDDLSLRLMPHFLAWKPLVGMSDKSAAEMIKADGVHILMDLSGHTAENRLPLFAWKPAPVQVSWLGYFATTGVKEIDYFIADEAGAPPSMQEQFCEQLWYLPETRMCFSPPAVQVEVGALPALANGYVTFGCFQNLKKMQPPVLKAWVDILSRMPTARLRIQSMSFAEIVVMDEFRERFRALGGDAERLSLHGPADRDEYLSAHNGIDMILDTFPFTGGTTTCEALWMGVPTLTLAGDSLIARQGASLMTAAGFSDWVASSTDEYVEKTLGFAADLQALSNLRQAMRAKVLGSALFDSERFSKNLEVALSSMWHAYKAKTRPA